MSSFDECICELLVRRDRGADAMRGEIVFRSISTSVPLDGTIDALKGLSLVQ
jgi:hypothetical protein